MHIDRVYFQRNFRIGEFLYENIGIGIAINEGEDAKLALDEAKELVNQYHWENVNKSLEHQQEEPLRDIQVQKPPAGHSLEEQIRACTTIKELIEFKLLADMNAKLGIAYTETLNKINNGN